MLAHIAERRAAVEHRDLHRTARALFDARRPWLGDIALEKALRTEEVAELECDRIGGRASERVERAKREEQGTHGRFPP
ncbi:MAG: hypothetical protein JF611_15260 [Betaproteobacteria bacterium]|nr:hypothetical protein [Betaproteobacteria bacterium]